MQFGVFSVGDVTTDPTTGRTPSEGERIEAMTRIALKAEEVGLDVFATGQHHNPPFVAPANPPVLLASIAAQRGHLDRWSWAVCHRRPPDCVGATCVVLPRVPRTGREREGDARGVADS